MTDLYKNDGLTASQIDIMNGLTVSYGALEGKLSSIGNDASISDLDQFNASKRQLLEGLGIDLDDPRIHFAVLAGATLMAHEVNQANDLGKPVNIISTYIMGSIVAARPLRAI